MHIQKDTVNKTKHSKPIIKRIKVNINPIKLFVGLRELFDYCYILESSKGVNRLARYTFIGFSPRLVIRIKDGNVLILDSAGVIDSDYLLDDPFSVLRLLVDYRGGSSFRFLGGAVGYISYDAIRYWEAVPSDSADELGFPDIEMGLYDDGFIFDNYTGDVFYFTWGRDRSSSVVELGLNDFSVGELVYTSPRLNMSRDYYDGMVARAKDYIESGDVFQVVVSKRYDFGVDGDLVGFYLNLRRINPSPYMYFLQMGDRVIIGSSPEMLVRVEDGLVETYPIAGTRPRVGDPVRDRELARELLSDPKERAEHVMLVDLARNDVGRVAEYGSVVVKEFMMIQEYSHVQHIVSRVVGKLRDGLDSFDAFKALFPAGTVTGAPKIRAMEIIDELEPSRRGPYAGAVGYFSYNGNMDFAITIRTLIGYGSKCSIQVGSGIVMDSTSDREWDETESKAAALFKALSLPGDSS